MSRPVIALQSETLGPSGNEIPVTLTGVPTTLAETASTSRPRPQTVAAEIGVTGLLSQCVAPLFRTDGVVSRLALRPTGLVTRRIVRLRPPVSPPRGTLVVGLPEVAAVVVLPVAGETVAT